MYPCLGTRRGLSRRCIMRAKHILGRERGRLDCGGYECSKLATRSPKILRFGLLRVFHA